jgi:Raf kinase inhibitor-like YbhB/YbcL family protein
MTKASKGPCATITPPDNARRIYRPERPWPNKLLAPTAVLPASAVRAGIARPPGFCHPVAVRVAFVSRVVRWALAAGAVCASAAGADDSAAHRPSMSIALTSPAFTNGQPIPTKFTCDGADVSPPLQWTNVPAGTRSLALIADDPDAPVGTWVHWVIYDLSSTLAQLPEGLDKSQHVLGGASQGLNDFRRLGYGGPCPPPGQLHHYWFKLYALDQRLELKPGLTKKDLLQAIEGHVLAEGQLMGIYQRR